MKKKCAFVCLNGNASIYHSIWIVWQSFTHNHIVGEKCILKCLLWNDSHVLWGEMRYNQFTCNPSEQFFIYFRVILLGLWQNVLCVTEVILRNMGQMNAYLTITKKQTLNPWNVYEGRCWCPMMGSVPLSSKWYQDKRPCECRCIYICIYKRFCIVT